MIVAVQLILEEGTPKLAKDTLKKDADNNKGCA